MKITKECTAVLKQTKLNHELRREMIARLQEQERAPIPQKVINRAMQIVYGKK